MSKICCNSLEEGLIDVLQAFSIQMDKLKMHFEALDLYDIRDLRVQDSTRRVGSKPWDSTRTRPNPGLVLTSRVRQNTAFEAFQ